MDFLEKLDCLMEKNHLNKNTLSKACDIPYTTIDGWYKKGYEGLKLTTLRKLANYFGTSLDFWADNHPRPCTTTETSGAQNEKAQKEFFDIFNELSPVLQDYLMKTAQNLLDAQSKME